MTHTFNSTNSMSIVPYTECATRTPIAIAIYLLLRASVAGIVSHVTLIL